MAGDTREPTFGDLFGAAETAGATPRHGDLVRGRVVAIEGLEARVDAGFATLALPLADLLPPGLGIGQEVDGLLLETARGPVISPRLGRVREAWESVIDAHARGGTVPGALLGDVFGGYEVGVGALSAFLPAGELDGDPAGLRERALPYRVLLWDRDRGHVVVSRRGLPA